VYFSNMEEEGVLGCCEGLFVFAVNSECDG